MIVVIDLVCDRNTQSYIAVTIDRKVLLDFLEMGAAYPECFGAV